MNIILNPFLPSTDYFNKTNYIYIYYINLRILTSKQFFCMHEIEVIHDVDIKKKEKIIRV